MRRHVWRHTPAPPLYHRTTTSRQEVARVTAVAPPSDTIPTRKTGTDTDYYSSLINFSKCSYIEWYRYVCLHCCVEFWHRRCTVLDLVQITTLTTGSSASKQVVDLTPVALCAHTRQWIWPQWHYVLIQCSGSHFNSTSCESYFSGIMCSCKAVNLTSVTVALCAHARQFNETHWYKKAVFWNCMFDVINNFNLKCNTSVQFFIVWPQS